MSVKFLPLIFRHLSATWVRTASTIISMALCVFLFCSLQSVLTHLDLSLIHISEPTRPY